MMLMRRYEVTLDDGWKTRVNAESAADACLKAESYNRGRKAVSATPCEEIDHREYL